MRIVHFRSNFDVGLGYDTLSLPLEQKKAGHDVIVVTTDRASPSNWGVGTLSKEDQQRLKAPSFQVEGLTVYRLPSFPLRYDDIAIPKGAARLLEHLKPDVVYAMSAKEIMPVIAAKNKKRLGYKLFIREDQYDFPASTKVRRCIITIEFLLWRRWWCDYVYNKCDAVFETSMRGVSFLKKYHHVHPDVPIMYTPVLVDFAKFFPDELSRKRIRKFLGFKPDHKVLITTGKIVPLKRFEVLIDAIAQISKRVSITVLIIGGGDKGYIESLKARAQEKGASDRIRFIPNVPHVDLPAYYNAADMGFWNRSTSSIQEAMSCGLPIIIPKFVSTVLPEYENCAVFKDGSAKDLADAITRLSTEKKYRQSIAARCLAIAKKRFSVAKQARELIEIFKRTPRRA